MLEQEAESHPFKRSASDGGDARCERAGDSPGLHKFSVVEQDRRPGLSIAWPGAFAQYGTVRLIAPLHALVGCKDSPSTSIQWEDSLVNVCRKLSGPMPPEHPLPGLSDVRGNGCPGNSHAG